MNLFYSFIVDYVTGCLKVLNFFSTDVKSTLMCQVVYFYEFILLSVNASLKAFKFIYLKLGP